jgi:hypothetical protein
MFLLSSYVFYFLFLISIKVVISEESISLIPNDYDSKELPVPLSEGMIHIKHTYEQ